MLLTDVALPVPIARAFTYGVPGDLAARVVAGARVVCPFGGRRLMGVALSVFEGEGPRGVKAVSRVIEGVPSVPEDLLAFLRDLASYYFAPIGEVVRLALPPLERATALEVNDPMLFDEARGVGARVVKWAAATATVDASAEGALRGQTSAVLAHVRALGAEPVARLVARWGIAQRRKHPRSPTRPSGTRPARRRRRKRLPFSPSAARCARRGARRSSCTG